MQIRLENLVRTYNGSIHAVQDVSLTIPENQIYGIIGLSGAGKSTLVRLMSLLEKPDSGQVFYDDMRVDNLSEAELIQRRRRIGMIFQNFNLFSSRNAGQNVAYPMEICKYPKDEIQKRVKDLMELVGLGDRIDAPISTLSGGQKQRVAIARALACKPDILFCDEATSALDPKTTKAILALIKDIQKQMNLTVVMITHQMEVVRDACDHVAVLSDGQVVENGEVRELFTHPKHKVTREFLWNIRPNVENEQKYYVLKFPDDKVNEPILSIIIRDYDVNINILRAGMQMISDSKLGALTCNITGEDSKVETAIRALREHGVSVEEIQL